MKTKIISVACAWGLLIPAAQAASDTEQRLQRLERRVGLITELTLEVEGLKRENRLLHGRVEELQHTVQKLQQKQRELYLDVDERLSRLGTGTAATVQRPIEAAAGATQVDPASPRSALPAQAATGALPPGDPAQEEAAYAAAYDLLRPEQRRYHEAIEAMQRFIKQYPDGTLTDNARYWLGEANYVIGNNDDALSAFSQVLEYHPQSPKAAGALLKIGYIQAASGNESAATVSLQRVIDDYPKSSAARMAKQRLVNMQRRIN